MIDVGRSGEVGGVAVVFVDETVYGYQQKNASAAARGVISRAEGDGECFDLSL